MGNFKDLPPKIRLDIITRLPVESILDCKLVCKPWRKLVSHHPSFSHFHLTHLNRSTDSAGKLSYLLYDFYQRLHYFEYTEKQDEAPVVSIRRFNLNPPFASSYKIIGSINGLVCLNGCGDHTTCICNPLTREYVMLPNLNRDSYWSTGFGYDSVSNEYKVVELHRYRLNGETMMEVSVYTIGSGKGWRIVGRLDTEFAKICHGHDGVFANEALYWMDCKGEKVVVFDLTEEKFGEHVSSPYPEQEHQWCDHSIGSFGGVLYYATGYYCPISLTKHFDMWLLKEKNDMRDMKEQLEHEPLGWRKELSIPVREPLAFTKSGGVLFYENSSFCIYDPVASTSKEVVDCVPLNQVVPHKNTLVSLKELGKENVQYLSQLKFLEKKSRDLPNSC